VRALRARLALSRPEFARRFGLAVAVVRDWEQGLSRPDPAAHAQQRKVFASFFKKKPFSYVLF
jgi:DNA-binding transcriptional regulator YiaG